MKGFKRINPEVGIHHSSFDSQFPPHFFEKEDHFNSVSSKIERAAYKISSMADEIDIIKSGIEKIIEENPDIMDRLNDITTIMRKLKEDLLKLNSVEVITNDNKYEVILSNSLKTYLSKLSEEQSKPISAILSNIIKNQIESVDSDISVITPILRGNEK